MGQERICGRHEIAARWNQKMGCWVIQLGMCLLWCRRLVGFWMTRRTAAWSLGKKFPEVLNDMTAAMEIKCFSHKETNAKTIHRSKSVNVSNG